MADLPIKLVVVTPEMTIIDESVDSVVAPLFDGEIGIAKGHAPIIGRLGYGELRYRQSGQSTRFYVEGGFIQVSDDVVSVMTGRAMPVSQIDVAEARKQLDEAIARTASGAEAAARDRDIAQARGKLRVAKSAS
ncbi:ATP synthase epsilon chain, sodium ion specific [Posidoniimonas corsicana]|uniref:ATP synthase epsilon chain n=1 Tax=Posidoniimonas corsicana TaxID=1938618 RepID=A0A5C5VAV0_9BACT|nr:ATP synthase F1 subunit epsilon [Posidoniimonas corsicana]TWT35746.1 ATP synthase epsilon chain, sodium ion specific [Posidoniimonas corsicana]